MTDPVNPLEMSDEEFLKDMDKVGNVEEKPAEPEKETTEPEQKEENTPEEKPEEKPSEDKPQEDNQENTETEEKPAEKTEDTPSEKSDTIDYEQFYKDVMTPFKANRKTITLKNAKEAIQLMQQGANYTRKMQELAPYRKSLLMLKDNGLLDENKINFLIDLDKKNPEAIKKLLKDAKIDPLDINTEEEPKYKEGTHLISDAEANLKTAINDLLAEEGGNETLQEISNKWDNTSKDEIGKDPRILSTINEQKHNGVYKLITDEIERLETLGQLNPNIPFLYKYKMVGDALVQQKQRTPVATGTRQGNQTQMDDAKVKKVAPNRTNKTATKQIVNYLEMSDDEFMKQFGGNSY